MPQTMIRLWPGVPDIEALGASRFEDLMGGGGLLGEQRAEVVHRTRRHTVLRVPLPGTPDREGRVHEAPRGAGTGWVYLTRYTSGPLLERADARLSSPRSTSFAARDWNLICHLREHGVGTPEPLAMGEVVRPLFSGHSFLMTRALDSMQQLPEWLERNPGADQRRRAALALGLTLARLVASRVHLPRLEAEHLYLSAASSDQSPVEDGACAARQIAALVHDGPKTPVPGTVFRQLPEVALGSVRSGRITPALLLSTQLELLRNVMRGLPPELWPTPREAYRVFFHAVGRGLPGAERRSLWKQLSS
jgi:hypothetical protein